MSGLDKMKVRILEDAKSTAAEITERREEAEAAVQAAREAAEAESAQIIERAERSASDHIRKAGLPWICSADRHSSVRSRT